MLDMQRAMREMFRTARKFAKRSAAAIKIQVVIPSTLTCFN